MEIYEIHKHFVGKPQAENTENTTLFARFDLPSTLIRHEKGSFSKTLFKLEKFDASFSILCGLKFFWKLMTLR